MNKIDKEAIKTDSTVSAMRIAFFRVIATIIGLSLLTVVAKIALSYKNIPFDITGIVALIGVLGTVAFGGKAAQSFSEKPTTNPIQSVLSSILPKKEEKPEDNR